jgi:hypothetical protein
MFISILNVHTCSIPMTMRFSCVHACMRPLTHSHWPDQAGGSRHERTGRHTSTLTISIDPQSSVLHLEMSIPMPMAPMRALQKIWWAATEKIKNSSVGRRRYGAWDGRSPDAGAPLKSPGTSQIALRLPPSEYRGCK